MHGFLILAAGTAGWVESAAHAPRRCGSLATFYTQTSPEAAMIDRAESLRRHAAHLRVRRNATMASASESPRLSIAVSGLKEAGLRSQRLVFSGVLANTPAISGHFEGSPKPSRAGPDVPTASGIDETAWQATHPRSTNNSLPFSARESGVSAGGTVATAVLAGVAAETWI